VVVLVGHLVLAEVLLLFPLGTLQYLQERHTLKPQELLAQVAVEVELS
jgi:hypothetical protein